MIDSTWITDRLPTEADGDCDGNVMVPTSPVFEAARFYFHWSLVRHGLSWRHADGWRPPASRLEFKVGQRWRTRDGRQARITKIDSNGDMSFPACSEISGEHWHHSDGRSCLGDGRDHSCDLVELLDDAAIDGVTIAPGDRVVLKDVAPEPTEIPAPIRAGDAPFYVLVVSNDGGGEPIAWEHPIPGSTTLQAVLKRQAELGDRYGTSYVAECRIIPQLTRAALEAQP